MPVASFFSWTLERWFPIRPFEGDADALVVLSGGIYAKDPSQPLNLPDSDTYLRATYAAWLYKNWRQVPIIASGGAARTENGFVILADVIRRVLEEQGVPPSMIWMEERSTSTYENVLYSAAILRQKGIRKAAVVTQAHHMLRTYKCFQRQGFSAVPAPFAYRSILFHGRWTQWIPNANAIIMNENSLHEWIGLGWYWIKDRI